MPPHVLFVVIQTFTQSSSVRTALYWEGCLPVVGCWSLFTAMLRPVTNDLLMSVRVMQRPYQVLHQQDELNRCKWSQRATCLSIIFALHFALISPSDATCNIAMNFSTFLHIDNNVIEPRTFDRSVLICCRHYRHHWPLQRTAIHSSSFSSHH